MLCLIWMQLNDRITEVLNAMMSKPPEVRPNFYIFITGHMHNFLISQPIFFQGDEVQLRVLFSSREPTLLTVRNRYAHTDTVYSQG